MRLPPQTRAKRHHLMPRAYLRRFSRDDRHLAVFDRTTCRFRIDVPENIAVETEFNTVRSRTGEKDRSAEVRLAAIDDAVALFDKLARREVLSRSERWSVSFFVGFAETRGRGFRNHIVENKPADEGPRVDFLDAEFAAAFSAMTGVILDARMIEHLVLEEMANVDPLTSGAFEIGSMVESAFLLARYAFLSDWAVMSAPGGFITSDRPIALLARDGRVFGEDPLEPGIVKALPLSSSHVLFMRESRSETAPIPYDVATEQVVAVTNAGVARRCDRYVIGSDEPLVRRAAERAGITSAVEVL